MTEREAYDELCAYTLSHGDPRFIHQNVVDAWAAQHAGERTKPIGLAFALVGLYLSVEKNVSGREVQRTHMRLARRKREWPPFDLPPDRGAMTALDVMAAPPGPQRDEAIRAWCAAAWAPFSAQRAKVEALLREQ